MSAGRRAEQPWLRRAPDLSTRSGLPAHQRIESWLAAEIGRGALAPGDRLPREDELARVIGVSRMTLRQALASLEARGAVDRRRGRGGGTFVAEPRFTADLTGLVGLTEQMRTAHVRVGARLVERRTVPAPDDVATGLAVPTGSPVHLVVRVRTAQRRPLALEHSWFPAGPFPDLLEHPLSGSLYRLLDRAYGRAPHTADERLAAVAAGDEEARLLEVPAGAPLMLVERSVHDVSGQAVEFARDLFRPDRIRIGLRTRVGGPARSTVTSVRG